MVIVLSGLVKDEKTDPEKKDGRRKIKKEIYYYRGLTVVCCLMVFLIGVIIRVCIDAAKESSQDIVININANNGSTIIKPKEIIDAIDTIVEETIKT